MKPKKRNPGVRPTPGFQDDQTKFDDLPITPECSSRLAPTARIEPTHFACVSSYYGDGVRHRVAIWNGVRNFASPPPPGLIGYMGMTGRIVIKQIERPLWKGGTSAVESCKHLIKNLNFDHVVFWARNKKVYESIKTEFQAAELTCFHPTPQ